MAWVGADSNTILVDDEEAKLRGQFWIKLASMVSN